MNSDRSLNRRLHYIKDQYPRIAEHAAVDPILINGSDFEKNVLTSIFGFTPLIGSTSNDWLEGVDDYNEYRFNSYGYRDPEYSGPVDLIAAGCSQTFGQGVSEDYRWSSMLGRKLGYSVATLGVPGWSAMNAIQAVMHFIYRYGKPKAVALYLPDFFRFSYIANKDILVDTWIDESSNNTFERVRLEIGHAADARHAPKVSKKPHLASDVINVETSSYLNGQTLRFFLAYCEEAGIDVVWASWEKAVQELVQAVKDVKISGKAEGLGPEHLSIIDFSSYVEVGYSHDQNKTLKELAKLSCHDDLKQSLDDHNKKIYDYATDIDEHMSIHAHAHVADAFYEKLKK